MPTRANVLPEIPSDGLQPWSLRRRLVLVYAVLTLANCAAWVLAISAFAEKPVMLGVAVIVYGLGLRHAIDADHIAAIDNVTRKLMREGERPVGVGFYFALGHSSIVLLVTAIIAYLAVRLERFERYRDIGGTLSTAVSAIFFIAVAAMNVAILLSLCSNLNRLRIGEVIEPAEVDRLAIGSGFLTRFFRPAFRLISRSWHMFPLGLLFGSGFDTASEVALFGVSAANAAKGIPATTIVILPALFAAGMTLVDTTDGVMMLGIYNWASVRPMRKVYYNMAITLISVVISVLIGAAQVIRLLQVHISAHNVAAGIATFVERSMNGLGAAIIGLFITIWAISVLIHARKRAE